MGSHYNLNVNPEPELTRDVITGCLSPDRDGLALNPNSRYLVL